MYECHLAPGMGDNMYLRWELFQVHYPKDNTASRERLTLCWVKIYLTPKEDFSELLFDL